MMSRKVKIGLVVFFAVAFAFWGLLFVSLKSNACTVFPQSNFEVYVLTDSLTGGFSVSEISVKDSSVTANVNIRSGKAFPYAGFGFNLASVNHRPVGFFDFSKYDSLEVVIATGRMQSAKIRIVTDDPIYSKQGDYVSYRPLEHSVKTSFSFAPVKVALVDFKTPEWWLAAQGLDHEDGLTYFYRSLRLEIFNGEGVLRGIPDDIEVKSIRMWGENRQFVTGMYLTLVFVLVLFTVFIVSLFWKPSDKSRIKDQMERVAHLLVTTDKSVAEIAIDVGLNPGQLGNMFKKVYGQKPLEYRKAKNA